MNANTNSPEAISATESRAEKTARLTALIRPIPDPHYTVDVDFGYVEKQLESYSDNWGLNLAPDFQRGHQWTEAQRIAYIEGIFRGTVGEHLRVVQFNAPHWENEEFDGDLPSELQIVDGLQRLTTVRMFMAGKLKAFGMLANEFEGSSYSPTRAVFRLKFSIHSFAWRKDLLRYYLDINRGGTPHSDEEIERVSRLLADC